MHFGAVEWPVAGASNTAHPESEADALVTERWRMKEKMGHVLTTKPQAPWEKNPIRNTHHGLIHTLQYL